MKTRDIFAGIIPVFMAAFLIGCSLAHRPAGKEIPPAGGDVEYEPGKGDAYLFDAKIIREGKKNSVRLEVYHSRDSLAVFARGYLGKGVLKAFITSDSVLAYFPTENQYYSGRIYDLISSRCQDTLIDEKMMIDLFAKTPAEIEYNVNTLYVVLLDDKGETRSYRLQSKRCPDNIYLQYDYHEERFILQEFSFEADNEAFGFHSKLRKFRSDVKLPPEKFLIEIPESAVRFTP